MTPLLLSLLLAQAPAQPPAEVPAAPPSEGQAAAPGEAAAEPPAAAAGPAPARQVLVARRPDGTFLATLDGQPVAGADFYRAVLRLDLADRWEQARARRTALHLAAGGAVLAGAGLGLLAATAGGRVPPDCVPFGPVVPDCAERRQRIIADNERAHWRGVAIGGGLGLAAGAGLLWLGRRVVLPEPTADEAEALVRAYRARRGGSSQAPEAPAGPALRLAVGPGGAALLVEGRF